MLIDANVNLFADYETQSYKTGVITRSNKFLLWNLICHFILH